MAAVAEDERMSDEVHEEFVTRYQCELIRGGMGSRLDAIEDTLLRLDQRLTAVWKKIDGRPSWAVLAIISLQSSIIVGFVVGIFMWMLR